MQPSVGICWRKNASSLQESCTHPLHLGALLAVYFLSPRPDRHAMDGIPKILVPLRSPSDVLSWTW